MGGSRLVGQRSRFLPTIDRPNRPQVRDAKLVRCPTKASSSLKLPLKVGSGLSFATLPSPPLEGTVCDSVYDHRRPLGRLAMLRLPG